MPPKIALETQIFTLDTGNYRRFFSLSRGPRSRSCKKSGAMVVRTSRITTGISCNTCTTPMLGDHEISRGRGFDCMLDTAFGFDHEASLV
jgi:hypothetical protein